MRASRNSLFKRFCACGPPANNFPKGLEFPRMAKVVSRMVWCSRAWRKSFPEWFGISVLGENHFPKGLEFPRMAKVISRMVWSSRAWRKSFPTWFGVSALGENYFPNGLELVVAKIWKYSSKVVMPARVRKPKDKALVEDAVKLTYACIVRYRKQELVLQCHIRHEPSLHLSCFGTLPMGTLQDITELLLNQKHISFRKCQECWSSASRRLLSSYRIQSLREFCNHGFGWLWQELSWLSGSRPNPR